MALGLGILRLAPRDFWAATPREIAAATIGLTGSLRSPGLPTRADLADLMRTFPDRPGDADHE